MKKIALILILSNLLFAECYVVNELKGKSYYKSDNFELKEDKFSYPFEININAENSSVSLSDLKYLQTSKNSILGLFIDEKDNKSTIETWFLYPESKKVIYTKSVTGYGSLDGSRMFIGKIVGNCNK